jgi:hypothetical protein
VAIPHLRDEQPAPVAERPFLLRKVREEPPPPRLEARPELRRAEGIGEGLPALGVLAGGEGVVALAVGDARRLRELQTEVERLKLLVAELLLDKRMLQDVAERTTAPPGAPCQPEAPARKWSSLSLALRAGVRWPRLAIPPTRRVASSARR